MYARARCDGCLIDLSVHCPHTVGMTPSTLTVITNNVPRDVIDAYELSADERAEFDYLKSPTPSKENET